MHLKHAGLPISPHSRMLIAPGGIRTPNILILSQMALPVDLPEHNLQWVQKDLNLQPSRLERDDSTSWPMYPIIGGAGGNRIHAFRLKVGSSTFELRPQIYFLKILHGLS